MDPKQFASQIIFESDLPYNLPKEEVPKIVDGAIWLEQLDITEDERQKIIDAVIELLPVEGWNR
jgi:hypothetical protein